jgi:hypothetical protein
MRLFLIFIGSILSCTLIIATTPVHEAAHWVMSDIDPYIEPIEIHIFDSKNIFNHQYILSSPLGYVVVKEKYPGAFDERPFWADAVQEIICVSLQIFITIVITMKILVILKRDYCKETYYK